jgi:hypothetical protein
MAIGSINFGPFLRRSNQFLDGILSWCSRFGHYIRLMGMGFAWFIDHARGWFFIGCTLLVGVVWGVVRVMRGVWEYGVNKLVPAVEAAHSGCSGGTVGSLFVDPQGTVMGQVWAFIGAANYLLPIAEALNLLAWIAVLWVSAAIFKCIKAMIPGM